jgi:hypothetical protein
MATLPARGLRVELEELTRVGLDDLAACPSRSISRSSSIADS